MAHSWGYCLKNLCLFGVVRHFIAESKVLTLLLAYKGADWPQKICRIRGPLHFPPEDRAKDEATRGRMAYIMPGVQAVLLSKGQSR